MWLDPEMVFADLAPGVVSVEPQEAKREQLVGIVSWFVELLVSETGHGHRRRNFTRTGRPTVSLERCRLRRMLSDDQFSNGLGLACDVTLDSLVDHLIGKLIDQGGYVSARFPTLEANEDVFCV
jgi:hypothetical protein